MGLPAPELPPAHAGVAALSIDGKEEEVVVLWRPPVSGGLSMAFEAAMVAVSETLRGAAQTLAAEVS